MYQFPEGFLWGTSTSGPQTEGRTENDGKGNSIWDYWYQNEPEKFFNQVGPEEASTFYKHWEEDIDSLEATGQTVFRTSIQWSRLIPEGVGKVNSEAVSFYHNVFQKIHKKGIHLIVNLYHFDLPYALYKNGGWENKDTVKAYVTYASKCFELFNDVVDEWTTFNEPIVPVEMGYFNFYHLPGTIDAKKAFQVAYNTQLASSQAVKELHKIDKTKKIGIIINLTPAYPRSSQEADVKAAQIADLFQSRSFLDPSVKGVYPDELIAIAKAHNVSPEITPTELIDIKENTVDFLGVNYYQPLRVQAPTYMPNPEAPFTPAYYYEPFSLPTAKVNPYRGWEIYERGIYDIAENLKDNYGNIPWLLTENGMGVENEERFIENGEIQDDYRIDFVKDHLRWLHRAIEEGANCHGYMMWTFIDCWSWLNAYKNRYGLVALDLDTQKRTIKKSGRWFKELSSHNGFSDD
ncbi:MAG: glycoside hydrolase family 1 protein [Aerococcus sp.]|nr:glycoside hydrolase family 1 protein [Aerococcus sp.]